MTRTGISAKLVLHRDWLRNMPGGERADLSGESLNGRDLSCVNLTEANLRDASLRGVNLSYAHLRYADLSCANLTEANLRVACLSGADLSGANLHDANLSGANLSYVNLSGANLGYANLSGADLSGANLSGANLIGANLLDANLSYANLRAANLDRVLGNMREVKSAHFGEWAVAWTQNIVGVAYLQIGCQVHPVDSWRRHDSDSEWIAVMDRRAAEWWRKYGAIVLALVDAAPADAYGGTDPTVGEDSE